MAESFQGFKALIENSPDALSVIDFDGEIFYSSASTVKVLGYQPEELLGRNCLDLIHPEDRDHSRCTLQEVLAKPPGPLRWNARVRHKDGNYSWVENTISNLLCEVEVQAMVVRQRDIDGWSVPEVEGQPHANELARSNLRLEEFAYIAAHDLREPLRTISTFTEMLVRETQMDAHAMRLAEFVIAGAARMSVLIDDLLSHAGAGVHVPLRNVNLQDAAAKASQDLTLAIKESGATVTVDRMPIVQGNEIHLARLFQNLIANAVKYRREVPVKIHITAEQRGSDWVIGIEDNGLGIAPENQARVFLPFIRLANGDTPGSGLGLAVCKRIVEGLGGTIWVQSLPGAGSTFFFTIAAAQAETFVPRVAHGVSCGAGG